MKTYFKTALIDSGYTSSCISQKFIQENKLETKRYTTPITCYNANRSLNKSGSITDFIEMNMIIGDHIEQISFAVTDLEKADLFLGYEWLQHHNSTIDWKLSCLNLDKYRTWYRKIIGKEEPEDVENNIKEVEGERILYINLEEEVLRRNQVEERKVESKKKSFKETVPKEYWEFKESVFDKKSFDQLPPRQPWDHAIELIPGATLRDCKIYSLSTKEQEELNKFLDEHLKSEKIRLLKSPYASPFFFVKKKDGSLCPVQDY